MMKNRLSIQSDPKGGWNVVVDGSCAHYDNKPEALNVVSAELGLFDELRAMNDDLGANVKDLFEKNEMLCKELASADCHCAKLSAELEKANEEKGKYALASYDAERDLLKLARIVARKFG